MLLSDLKLMTDMDGIRSTRKELHQDRTLLEMPNEFCNCGREMEWSMLSKAAERSSENRIGALSSSISDGLQESCLVTVACLVGRLIWAEQVFLL